MLPFIAAAAPLVGRLAAAVGTRAVAAGATRTAAVAGRVESGAGTVGRAAAAMSAAGNEEGEKSPGRAESRTSNFSAGFATRNMPEYFNSYRPGD